MTYVWVGIFALVALLIYVAMSAFNTSSGDPVAKADRGVDRGIEADPDSLQDVPDVPGKAPRKTAAPVPTITLQGFQRSAPGAKVTVTPPAVTVTVPVPGPTVTARPPAAPTVTKTVNARPAPGPTVTVTETVQAVAPAPTVTVTETVTEKAKPKKPRPIVTVTIYLPGLLASPDPSPSGGE